ncbi:non-ribosomal peptide synthetase [Gemmobacter denitrificans]|uniref:Amino acid adenylation domain-containing protein n=1 Tax=Gemmobacter denitrificans TaxID=3123040 RepID=A0ABU8BXC8_9RHOB
MQAGLLYESSLSGRPWANVEQVVVTFRPDPGVDADRIRNAWAALSLRHEALRSRFVTGADGTLMQEVLAEPAFGFDVLDWTGLSSDQVQASMAAHLRTDRDRGADPLQSPGWRVALIRQAEGRITLVWTIHHALIDGPGLQIALHDLFDDLAGRAPVSAAGQIRPQATAAMDHGASDAPAEPEHAMQQMLADAPDCGSIATHPDAEPGRMTHLSRRLAVEVSGRIKETAHAAGVTSLNMVQLAWGLVLARWTGENGALYGLVDSLRNHRADSDRTVGCLITTVPFQVGLTGGGTLRDLLTGLRQQTRALRRQGRGPADDLRQASGGRYDSILVFSPATLAAALTKADPAWQEREVTLHEEGAALLMLAVYDDPEMLVELEFDPARLDPARAARLLDHVMRLLEGLATADLDAGTASLDMLAPAEAAELQALAQPDHAVEGGLPCIATRFERMAAAQPDAIALDGAGCPHGPVSYAVLDAMANALAHRLAAAGLGPGDLVAVLLPRGADHVTALLAVLKLGAAFLPLDPGQPQAVIAGLLQRAGVQAAMTSANARPLPGVALQFAPDPADRAALPPPRPDPDAGRLAYVIHTSGSTGLPKGVMGLCGALSAHADAVIQAYGLTAQDAVLQFAGLAFDVALEEILPTLLIGGRVVFRDEASALSVSGFLDHLARFKPTVLNLPASFWHVLVDDLSAHDRVLPPEVRLMITGSERINPRALVQWQRLGLACDWINAYGPTEATISCIAHRIAAGATAHDPGQSVPIGRPLGHATAWVRAFDGTLAPRGAEGVLWVGGPAVAGGYLHRPEETALRFHPDPAGGAGRIYDTGDRACWRADGCLDFLGRRDREVKLRGHRIDLNQIETVIGALPGVQQVHVALDGETGGQARLLAWVMVEGGPAEADLAGLRRAAGQELPSYMVPSVVAVDRLPVNANGKIDTAALPRPMRGVTIADTGSATALDPLAAVIARCMAEVLKLDIVAPDADFHELGGDSLLALRVVSLFEARSGRRLRAMDLHLHPTAIALAALLREDRLQPKYLVPIQPEGRQPAFFAVHVLGRNEELFRPLAASLGPDYPVFGLTIGMPRNLAEIDVQRTARVYFEEIQTHHPAGPIGLGAVSMAAYFAFELAQLLISAGREVRVLAILDAMGPDGRPALGGMAKLRAHLDQLRQQGRGHLAKIWGNRLQKWRDRRDARQLAPGEVNGFSVVQANVRAVESYAPLPYEGRLAVFRADASYWDSPEAIASGLGWASVAQGGLEIHDLPGDHLSILHPGNVDVLAGHLRRMLAEE